MNVRGLMGILGTLRPESAVAVRCLEDGQVMSTIELTDVGVDKTTGDVVLVGDLDKVELAVYTSRACAEAGTALQADPEACPVTVREPNLYQIGTVDLGGGCPDQPGAEVVPVFVDLTKCDFILPDGSVLEGQGEAPGLELKQ